MDFHSAYAQGFARVAACTIPITVADPTTNAATIIEQARLCHDDNVAVAVFPELSLCGYAVDDLLLQDTLLESVVAGIPTRSWPPAPGWMPVIIVGVRSCTARVLNCAVVIHRGEVLGVASKSHLADLPRVLRAPMVRARRRPP